MKLPEPPASSHEPSASDTQPVSMEQLLSLRTEKLAQVPRHGVKSSKENLESALAPKSSLASSENPNKPVLLVVHQGLICDALMQVKFRLLENHVHLQWLSLHEANAEKMVASKPYAVVVEFDPNALDLASAIASGLQQLDDTLAVFAMGNTSDPQSMFAALRAGVQDFLDIDVPEPVLQQSVQDVLKRSGNLKAHEKTVAKTGPDASMVALVSARGGLGCSLLAVHIAVFLQEQLKKKTLNAPSADSAALQTLLLDLGGPIGDGALYLNLLNEFDFYEAVQSLRRFDGQLASAGLAQHISGLRILSLKRQHEILRTLSASDVEQLLARLKKYFSFVVADMGAAPEMGLTCSVASHASRVWLLCDQSLGSVVASTELLRQLEAQNIERSRIGLIVSRHEPQIALEPKQIAEQLGLSLIATIPERRRVLLQSINKGQLLFTKLRREPYVTAVNKLVNELLLTTSLESAQRLSWWERLFHRSKG